jgi:hypothetical protein
MKLELIEENKLLTLKVNDKFYYTNYADGNRIYNKSVDICTRRISGRAFISQNIGRTIFEILLQLEP